MSKRGSGEILEELLVLRSQEGDAEAFGHLVRRYQARLARHAFHLTGAEDAAADVVQDSWIAVARGLPRLTDPACFRTWVYRIVSAKSVDWIRNRQRERHLAVEYGDRQARSAPHGTDDAEEIRAAVAKLSAEQRALVHLYYGDGLSVPEIAEVFAIPQGTVKSRLHQVRQELRDILERSRS